MNMKRMRGRNHRGNGGSGGGGGGIVRQQSGNVPMNRNHVFDSSGPDLRIRGTSQQLFEKYLQLGRDATGSGDRVMAESYFQYAEHYFRILNAMNQAAQQQGDRQQGDRQQGDRPYNDRPYADRGGDRGGERQQGAPRRDYQGEQAEEGYPEAEVQPVEARSIPIESGSPEVG